MADDLNESVDSHLDIASALLEQMNNYPPDSPQYRECVVLNLELMLTGVDRTEARLLVPDVAIRLEAISPTKVKAYREALEGDRERLRAMIKQVKRGEVMEAINKLPDHVQQSHLAFADFMELFDRSEDFGSN